jgi:hypothetical protein
MMIETRLDMQRAKRRSFARARPESDDLSLTGAEGLRGDAPLPVTAADDLAAMMDAEPIKA